MNNENNKKRPVLLRKTHSFSPKKKGKKKYCAAETKLLLQSEIRPPIYIWIVFTSIYIICNETCTCYLVYIEKENQHKYI